MTTRHNLARGLTLAAVLALAVGACSSTGGGASGGAAATIPGVPQSLIDAAKAEGNLTTIALPHSWCDYGDLLSQFTKNFGIKINELNPKGGSKDEITALEQPYVLRESRLGSDPRPARACCLLVVPQSRFHTTAESRTDA